MKVDRRYREDPLFDWFPHRLIGEMGLDAQKSLLENKDNFKWGTYGKEREHSLQFHPLVSLTTEHLQNILKTENWISPAYYWVIEQVLEDRKNPAPKELFEL